MQRARKAVVIRAYNSRLPNQTLSEQFQALCRKSPSGKTVLLASDVKDALGLSELSWFDDLLVSVAGNEIGELDFNSFVGFLETGSTPRIISVSEPKNPPAALGRVASLNAKISFGESAHPPPGPPLVDFSAMQPSGAARDHQRVLSQDQRNALLRRSVKDSLASRSSATYPDVLAVLKFKEPTQSRELTLHAGSTVSLTFADSYRKAGPTRPLWRKRETVVQERIVHYTTVDADGTVQELVESERSQNEVVHLECKETGEFAHRESQEYEQLETFNNEVVAAERGNEEYLHMKSKDDEYEHLESNMPRNRRAEEEAAAAAAVAEEEAARAAEQAIDGEHQTRLGGEGGESGPGMGPGGAAEFDADAHAWWEAQQGQPSGLEPLMENQDKENYWAHDAGGQQPPSHSPGSVEKGWWAQQQQKENGFAREEPTGFVSDPAPIFDTLGERSGVPESTTRAADASKNPLDGGFKEN